MVEPAYIIEFDEATHTYTVNGEVKRSVTQTLKDAGIVGDYSGMDDFYRDRGIAVHHFAVLYAQGWLNWETIAEDSLPYFAVFERLTWDDVEPYVRTFERIVWELGLVYVSAEQPCYDEEYDICGTFDLIMQETLTGMKVLVELKTSKFEMYHGLQLASYERMVDVDDVMGLELKTSKIYVPTDTWHKNHDALHDIHNGTFDLQSWKIDKKRRHMKVLKGAA